MQRKKNNNLAVAYMISREPDFISKWSMITVHLNNSFRVFIMYVYKIGSITSYEGGGGSTAVMSGPLLSLPS